MFSNSLKFGLLKLNLIWIKSDSMGTKVVTHSLVNIVQGFSPEQEDLPHLPNADEDLRRLEALLSSLHAAIMPIVQGS